MIENKNFLKTWLCSRLFVFFVIIIKLPTKTLGKSIIYRVKVKNYKNIIEERASDEKIFFKQSSFFALKISLGWSSNVNK